MSYPDVPNPDLLSRIPLTARLVIDVGCATGALGAAYKRRNPAARVIGIEIDREAAQVAATRLDTVILADLDRDPVPFADALAGLAPDCIVYGDVLEHLRDPWGVLAAHAKLLADEGVIVVCLPNIEHWSFAAKLLRGTWDYERQGLLDRTHLRWFTPSSTRAAFKGAGLHVHDVHERIFLADQADAFVDAIGPGLRRFGVDVEAYRQRSLPLQYVWRAGRSRLPRITVASTMLPPQGGVSHLRVIEPQSALASLPDCDAPVLSTADAAPDCDTEARIFIFHRPILIGHAGQQRLRAIIAAGWLVVCEFDDHPEYLPVLQRPDILNFSGVHAVQTSTEPLAEVFRRSCPEVAVFPNSVAELPDIRNYRPDAPLSLLFAGLNREGEWPPYMDAINAVARDAGERLHVSVVGDRAFFEALETSHKTLLPLCDYETYHRLLAASDVSFMPLADTTFNRGKSDLKFIEAASHRVVALASEVVYGDVIEDGVTGLVFRSADELRAHLARLVSDRQLGRAVGDAARAYVLRSRMLADQVAARRAWYWSLWKRRDELRADLARRHPALAA